jgi:N-acetylmuramoyl-L-alanine amidase
VALVTLQNGMKLGKAEVFVNIVPKGNKRIRPAIPLKPKRISVHNTANPNKGAGAKAHNKLLHNESAKGEKARQASYHFSVDDKYICQNLPLNEVGWATGDGSGADSGNMTAIHIEICENVDMDYHQAEENAIALIRYLMKEFNIPLSNVLPHKHFSGKHCPHKILDAKGGWDAFVKRIANANAPKTVTASVKAPTTEILEKGDKGDDVKKLQELLNKAGANPKLVVDGVFGDATYKAVREFQTKHKLTVDGIVGNATMTKLKAVVAEIEAKAKAKTAVKAPQKLASNVYGVVTVLADKLNIREKADFNSRIVAVAEKGDKFNVYAQKNGLYHLGGNRYCTSNPQYVKFEKNPSYKAR